MKKRTEIWALVVLALIGGGLFFVVRDAPAPRTDREGGRARAGAEKASTRPAVRAAARAGTKDGKAVEEMPSAEAEEGERPPAAAKAEEARAEAEEKCVRAFETETDRWMDAAKTKPPTMSDVEKFRSLFKAVPKARKDECLHRALNLVPDENVMLLAGILMDKTEDAACVKLVFNDVLNRDEDVKKPILREIFKDKTHPCWTDAAWILDVTGAIKK